MKPGSKQWLCTEGRPACIDANGNFSTQLMRVPRLGVMRCPFFACIVLVFKLQGVMLHFLPSLPQVLYLGIKEGLEHERLLAFAKALRHHMQASGETCTMLASSLRMLGASFKGLRFEYSHDNRQLHDAVAPY